MHTFPYQAPYGRFSVVEAGGLSTDRPALLADPTSGLGGMRGPPADPVTAYRSSNFFHVYLSITSKRQAKGAIFSFYPDNQHLIMLRYLDGCLLRTLSSAHSNHAYQLPLRLGVQWGGGDVVVDDPVRPSRPVNVAGGVLMPLEDVAGVF